MSMLLDTAADLDNETDDKQQIGMPEESTDGNAVRAVLTASSGMNAQSVARSHMLAQRLGLPEGVVQTDPAAAQREHTALTIEQSRLFAKWAVEDGARAAIARDDAQGLARVFNAVSGFVNRETKALGTAWDLGDMQVQYSRLGERYRAGEDVLQDIQALRSRMAESESRKSGSLAETIGLATAAGQIPMQLNMTIPSATEALGMGLGVWGASTLAASGTGAAAGSIVPGAGTLAGGAGGAAAGQPAAVGSGLTAAKATYLARQAQRSFSLERGAFIADLAQEKDLEDQPIPRGILNAAADIYGFMAAAVETGGEAVFLKLLKPLGGQALTEKIGQEGVKGFLKSAVKRAAMDKSVRGALLDIGARIGLNALSEGLEESVQEFASILAEVGAKKLAERTENAAFLGTELFTAENAGRIAQAFSGGAAAGAWLGGGPIILSGAFDVQQARQAQTFARQQTELHAQVEATNTKQLSPPYMQDALEAAGLNQNVALPADAVLELYQQGTNILAPMGWEVADIQAAAALGQDVEAPLSRLHAYLDQPQFEAAARIMRASPESQNLQETAELDERVEEAARMTLEDMEQYRAEQNAIDTEVERLRGELAMAMQSVPGLEAQLRADSTLEESAREQGMTPQKAADYVLDLHTSFARRLSQHGVNPADYLRKLNVAGLVRDARGRLVVSTSEVGNEGLSQNQLRAARRESPIGETVWGQLDRTSIREAYGPDTVKAIEERYGRGVFAKSRGKNAKGRSTLSNDGLAGELVRRGFLPEGATLDDMVNYLAYGEGVDSAGTLFQSKAIPAVAVRGDELGVPDGAPIKEYRQAAREVYRQLQKTPAQRADLGEIRFTTAGFGKLFATGADPRKWQLVPRLKELVENAAYIQRVPLSKPRQDDIVAFHWLEADVNLNGEPLRVGIQIAEDSKGNKFYNLNQDLEGWNKKNEALAGHRKIKSGPQTELQQSASAPLDMNIDTEADGVNLQILPQYFSDDSAKNVRGSVSFAPEEYTIQLFKKADLSTLLHETGHVFLNELQTVLDMGLGDELLRADFDTIRTWLDAKPGEAFTTEQHEKFARGFEAWLREGKAPARNLESAFARFRKWLTRIYRKAQALNVELTDDVRDVFGRMLATDQEIEAAARENGLHDLTRKELDALGVQGAERVYASGLMRAAKDAAATRMQEARDANRKEQLAAWAREAREEIARDPLYVAMRGMRAEPLDLEAVRETLGEDMAASVMRRVPGGLKRGGVSPEIFAAEHGFKDGAGFMISQMLAAPTVSKRARELMAERQRMHDLLYDPADFLLETEQAAEQAALVGKYIAKAAGNQVVEQKSVARVAEERLAALPMGKAMRVGTFRQAMRRALEKERRAVAKGDFSAALDANTQARLNMEFARRSADLANGQKKLAGRIRRFTGMSKADPQARFIVMDVAMRHGLGKFNARLAEGKSAETVRDWLNGAEHDGYTLFLNEEALQGNLPWREMSVTDFESLAESVNQIITVEQNRRKLLTARNKEDLDSVAENIATEIGRHRSIKTLKTIERDPALKKLAAGVHAVHTKIEALCLTLDGDKPGMTWEYIYKPITEAEDAQNNRFKAARDALRGENLFGAYSRKELADMGRKKVFVSEVGQRLTHENRIAVALNMGNAANIERVKDGFGWTDEQIAAVVRPLTRKDWNFVQSVWDYLESFREESFALQEEVTGMRPTAVEAQPVQTPYGVYRGGYYPIRYNAEKSFRAFQQDQAAMDKELFGGRNYGAAQTRQGHLKERAKGGLKSPLLLELTVVTDHVFNVLHDLSYRKAVLDVAKVIRHNTVRQAIEGAVGREMYRELMPWLQDVANERQEPMHYVHRWARWARSSTSIMQMGWKFTTMLTQPLGYTQTVETLGYRWSAHGLKRVYANPLRLPALLEETFARSPMMASRIKSFDREVRDIAKQLKPRLGRFAWLDTLKDTAFIPMGLFQMSVDLPTWWGAYDKGLKDFAGDERRAASYADSVVRISQGSGATKDLARVQRGGELMRLTTMFYSYFNTFYNLAARRFSELRADRSPAAIFKAANTALLLWFVPAVLSELVAGRGPEDDEDPWEWATVTLLQYPLQVVVGLRDVASAAFGEYGYQITPAQSAPASLVKWFKSVNKALEEEDAGMLIKPTAEAAGYLLGLPLKQPIITVGNVWDYMTGIDPEFEVRDLFFVKPKNRR